MLVGCIKTVRLVIVAGPVIGLKIIVRAGVIMAKRKCKNCSRELKGGDGYFILKFDEKFGKEVVVKVCGNCFAQLKHMSRRKFTP